MRVLVTGGTGTVGGRVVGRLAERDVELRVLSRSVEPEAVPEGVVAVPADLGDPDTLDEAFRGVDRVFLLTPLHPREAELGKNAVEAAARAGAERVVLLSVHRVEEGGHIPHFASKIEIAAALEEAGLPHVVVAPNNFYQNDLWLRDAIVEMGVYPQPLGDVGLHRVDTDDVAEVVVASLLEDGLEGETIPVVGPEAWTGESTAETWARAVGAGVVYAGDDLDRWAAVAGQGMPEWMVKDLRVMYAHFQEEGLRAREGEVERVREILGREPLPFGAFAARTAAAWKE